MNRHLAFLSLVFCFAASNLQGQTLSWFYKADVPSAVHVNGARSFGMTTLDGKLYTLGGLNWPNPIASVLEYDASSNAWTQLPDMAEPRLACAAAALDGKVYALGGTATSGSGVKTSVECYDVLTMTWTNRASMNQARYASAAATANGKIYIFGGQADSDVPLSSVEEYDPTLNMWTYKTPMPFDRVFHGAVFLDGLIYIIGGTSGNALSHEVYSYDPDLDLWHTNASLPTTRGALGVTVMGGRIWAIGGSGPGIPRATIEVYDAAGDVWLTKPELPTTRNECFAAVLNGELYVFGGYDNWTMQSALLSPLLSIYTAVELDFLTETGKTYQIIASPDLTSWTNFGAPIEGDGNYWSGFLSTKGTTHSFFNVVELP